MGDTAVRTRRAPRPADPPALDIKSAHSLARRLVEGLASVIRGKELVLEQLVTGILAGGHVLIEDVPGLGKTTLAKTVARLVNGGQMNLTQNQMKSAKAMPCAISVRFRFMCAFRRPRRGPPRSFGSA